MSENKAMSSADYRNDPLIWRAACERILNSLRVMKRGAANATDLEDSDSSLTAMMLVGFAFENAFKAKVLRDGCILYQDGKMRRFRHHEYVQWADDYGITFEGWEREALDKAEFFCVAWGRYPAHNRMDKERPLETWGWNDVDQLENLIRRLNNQTRTSQRTL
jgi:hypothetical protein